jgi:hypothetical protein
MQHFRLQRHKSYHRNGITVIVNINNRSLELRYSPNILGNQLKVMIASRLRVQATDLYLMNGKIPVSITDPISDSDVKHGSVITQWSHNELRADNHFQTSCMTSILAQD